MEWPEWWHWDLEISSHVERRMEDRDFNEVELREMLEKARSLGPDVIEGRWLVQTRHRGSPWEIVVEPEIRRKLVVVITAYRLEA